MMSKHRRYLKKPLISRVPIKPPFCRVPILGNIRGTFLGARRIWASLPGTRGGQGSTVFPPFQKVEYFSLTLIKNRFIYYIKNMNKELFVPENREIVENLKIGEIFSAYNFPLTGSFNGSITSPEYMVNLGVQEDFPDTQLFLVVLKNGDTVMWPLNREIFEKYLDNGFLTKSKRKKTVPREILDEIQNFYPNIENAKEITRTVGNEINFGKKEIVHLPNNVKNELVSYLTLSLKGRNQFPEDFINETKTESEEAETEKEKEQQNAGTRKRRSKKNRKNKKYRKSRKSRKYKKSRNIRKIRK